MSKINVYITDNMVLTTAAYQTTEKYRGLDKDGELIIEKTKKPTVLVGYMDKALTEELTEVNLPKEDK